MVLKVIDILPNAKEVSIPEICEVFGTTITNTGERFYCPKEKCPKRLYHRIKKWIETLPLKNLGQILLIKRIKLSPISF